MAEKHPDLLDYLYEELPPREMVEARKHIAQCTRCLEELKNLREPVKHYRDIPRPAVPMGLAERTEAKALGAVPPAEALTESEHASLAKAAKPLVAAAPVAVAASAPEQPPASQKHENAESVQREIEELKAKRSWFFHPAWTVAASVFFIFAILIHFSPRGSGWYGRGDGEAAATVSSFEEERSQPAGAAPYSAIETDTVRDAEPLPALPQQESPAAPSEPPKPASLSIAETLVREAPVIVPEKLPSMNKSAVAAQRTAAPSESPAPTVPAAPTPPVQASMPEAAPALEPAAAPPPPAPAFDTAAQYATPMAAPAYSGGSGDSQEDMPIPSAPLSATGLSLNAFEASVEELADQSVDIQPVPDEPKDILSLDPAELEALLSRHGKEAAISGDMGIVDMTGFGQPPQLIERPEGVDKNEIIRNLIFLIGVHLGEKEFDEARQGIDLLRRYEPEQANRFAAMLLDLEAAQPEPQAEQVEVESAPVEAPVVETRTLGEMIRDITDQDIPQSLEDREEPPAISEPAVETPMDRPTDIQPGVLLPGEWREASAAPENTARPIEDPQPEAVIIVEEPQATAVSEPITESIVTPVAEPIYESVPDSEEVPLITGPTPGAQPPTLLESGPFGSQRFGRSQQTVTPSAPAYSRPITNRRSPANRPFTTDPYYRGD